MKFVPLQHDKAPPTVRFMVGVVQLLHSTDPELESAPGLATQPLTLKTLSPGFIKFCAFKWVNLCRYSMRGVPAPDESKEAEREAAAAAAAGAAPRAVGGAQVQSSWTHNSKAPGFINP
jgi:hypothetical protein